MSELEDRIRERALRRQQSDAGMSVVGTRGANSDIAGRANALSRRLGIPADVIERNIQEIEDRDRAQANARMVRDASPYVRDWFANPRNAAAAKDDVPALVSMSGRYAAIGKFGAPKPQTDFRKAPDRRTYTTDTQAKKDLAQDLFDATAEGPLAAQYRYQDQTPTDIGAAMKEFEWDQKSLVGKAGTVARETITGVIPSTVAGFYGQTAPNAQGFTSALSDVVEGIGSEFVGFGADLLNMYFGVRLEGSNPLRQMTENRHAREKAMAEQSSAYAEGWRPETSNWISEEINQGFESLPTSVLALVTRDPKIASSLMGSATAGGEYVRAREAGLSLPEALAYGARQGVVEAITEHMPASKFLGDLASKSPFGKMLFNQLATEMPGEQVATILQSFDEWVTLNPDKPLSEYVATLPDQMRQTFLATLGTVGAMTGGAAIARGTVNAVSKAQAARARGQMRNAVEAVETQAGANIMDGIMEDAAKSKIRQTDPEAFRQYLEGATAGTPVENVYIPGDAIRELMQDGYRDAPFWSDHADQIDEAIALGGDVVLPLADVATNLAGTPEWQVLREDARFSPGGMSTAELASLSEAYAKDREIGQARIAEEMDRAARDAEPVNRVYQSYREQFQNAGFRPDAADRYASIWVANREAWAQRLGMSIEEYDAANPVEFRRVLPESLARAIPADGLDMVINAMRAPERGEKKGPSLLDFIASRGGIVDQGGDIASMGGNDWHREKRFRKKLLTENGEPVERVIEAARDAGYDVDETNFLDTVGAELRGQPVYANEALTQSETERVRAAAEDLRRILLDRGVDPDGATKSEIEQAVEAYRKEELSGRGLEQNRDGSGWSSSGSLAPLAGAPNVQGATGPDPALVAVAESYAKKVGLTLRRQADYARIDPAFSRRIAEAYEAMPHAPNDPAVREAYEDLIRQTRAQYDALVEAGYEFFFFDETNDPYDGNPWNAMRDLRQNKRMGVFATEAGFGTQEFDASENPLLADTGIEWMQDGQPKRVLANDLFRAVHDAFGHGLEGAGFRARGEENAWQAHARLFTGPALAALTTETRGQNSWLNFGPHGEANQTASVEDTVFADQKTGLMPSWTWEENVVPDESVVPGVVYHGTPFDFDEFRDNGRAVWFSRSEKLARTYADPRARRMAKPEGRVIEGRIAARNPLVVPVDAENVVPDALAWAKDTFGFDLAAHGWKREPGQEKVYTITRSKAFADAAREAGYDVISIKENGTQTWGALTRYSVSDAETGRTLYQTTPFYSALERAVDGVQTKRAPAAQWLATLKKAPGVKAEELEWTGLEEWLADQTAPVEKEAVLDVVRQGAVTVEEVVLGDPENFDEGAFNEELMSRQGLAMDRFFDYYEPSYHVVEVTEDEDGNALEEPKWAVAESGSYDPLDGEIFDNEDEASERADDLDQDNRYEAERDWLNDAVDEAELREQFLIDPAEYASYSSDPSSGTYRELLIRFPLGEGNNPSTDPSTHWNNHEGVVAHARFMDKRGPNGEKILFVEEVQSDWHQQGREQGYDQPADPETTAKAVAAHEEASANYDAAHKEERASFTDLLDMVRPLVDQALDDDIEKGYAKYLEQQEAKPEGERDSEQDRAQWKETLREVVGGELYRVNFLKTGDLSPRALMDVADNVERRMNNIGDDATKLRAAVERLRAAVDEEVRLDQEVRLRQQERRIAEVGGDIADAPFKTTWPDLVMKRLIVWAVEGNYDQVAWIKSGENNGGMNDNVGWFYERNLPNITNKIIKKYGAKVEPVKVNGMKAMPNEAAAARASEIEAELSTLRRDTGGVATSGVVDRDVLDAKIADARAFRERLIERDATDADYYRGLMASIESDGPISDASPAGVRADFTRYENQLREKEERIAIARQELEILADPDALWEAAQRARALGDELDTIRNNAPTNLGFTITPEMRASAREGFPLFQQGGEGPRGRVSGGLISGTEGPAIVELFEGSDMSTVLHETSHIWLEELKRNAMLPDAPDDVREDWRTVEAWFAENGFPVADDFIPTEAHEMFARAGEQYFMEGRAPSSALKRAFDTFRGWLLNIYEVVANLRTPITPDIRRVFDRMLATREALDDYSDRQQLQARFENAEQAGMTREAFASYQRLADEARTEAYDALLFRTMESIRKERTKEYKARAAAVRDDVTESVNKRPAFRALHLLRTGRFLDDPEREPMKVKLDRGWLVERFGEDALMMLPKGVPPIYSEGGDHPDTVANLAGFTSGEDMVRALMGLERQKEQMREAGDKRGVREATIADETNRIMSERYGNPLDDGSIEEEALAAVHNEKEGELIAAENRQLARQSNKRPTAYRLAREWAREKIAKGRVVDVASKAALHRYARAQAKAAREFEAALVAGNIDEAFRASETRLLNHALIVEAKAAADKVEVAVGRLSRLSRTPVRKSTDQEYMDRAQALLAKFEFRPRSQKLLDEMEAFGKWAAEQAANGVDVVVPPRLEADGVHYSRMSVEELVGLDESVSQLLHLGRMKKSLLDQKEKREFDAIVAEAVSVVEDLPQRKKNNRMRPSWLDDRRAGLASADAALLKMEQVFDWLDNGNPNGVFNRLVFQPIADAQDAERRMIGDYLGKVRDLLRGMSKENVARWEDHVSAPELLNRETGQPFDLTRQELIAAALNVGNEGNFDKLVRGYGWNPDGLMRVLSRELTAEDWRFVQATWDLIDTLWPQVEALEKRVNGVAPEKVEARAFEVHVGDQTIAMRGGYYPVVYDPLKSIDAEAQAAKNSDALFSNIYTRATTPKGFTKERTGVVRPVLLSMSVINRHLTEVIHDVTHREAIIQADKLLSDRRVMKAVDNAFGREVRKQMRPWLQHIANEWAVDRRGLEGWDALAKRLRTHSTIIGMGYRLTSVLAQTAGYAGVAEAVGTRWLASGMKATLADPVGTYDFVMERSKEVSARMETMERDINANIRDLQGKSGLLANVRRFAFHGIGYMDRVVVIPAWIGSYNKALREGMTEDEAVHYADKIIRQTQGSGAAKDLAAVQRNSEWMRLATMFYSYASAFYNRQRNLGRDAAGAWRGKDVKALPGLVARAWWLFAVAPLLGALPGAILSGGGPDDDESWFAWAMGVMGANFFYGVPIVRDIASSAASGFDYSFTPASRMVDTIMQAGSDLVALGDMDEETETSKRSVKTAVESVGYVTKLPVGQVSNAAQFIADWATGEADPDGVGDWLTGLQRGKLEE